MIPAQRPGWAFYPITAVHVIDGFDSLRDIISNGTWRSLDASAFLFKDASMDALDGVVHYSFIADDFRERAELLDLLGPGQDNLIHTMFEQHDRRAEPTTFAAVTALEPILNGPAVVVENDEVAGVLVVVPAAPSSGEGSPSPSAEPSSSHGGQFLPEAPPIEEGSPAHSVKPLPEAPPSGDESPAHSVKPLPEAPPSGDESPAHSGVPHFTEDGDFVWDAPPSGDESPGHSVEPGSPHGGQLQPKAPASGDESPGHSGEPHFTEDGRFVWDARASGEDSPSHPGEAVSLEELHSDAVHRTPHLDLPPSDPSPGDVFDVSAYVDTSGLHVGEEVEPVSISLPVGIETVELDVWLAVSPQISVLPPFAQTVVVARAIDRSAAATFHLRVDPMASASKAVISANFTYRGRPCGSVWREMMIARPDEAVHPSSQHEPLDSVHVAEVHEHPRIEARTNERTPDLTIQVVRAGEGLPLTCRVESPHIEKYARGIAMPWPLPADPAQLVKTYMKDFEQPHTSLAATTSSLCGAGRALFNDTPENFKDAYWTLVDDGKPLKTILVVSDDHTFPWELVAPYRPELNDFRLPLGAEFLVGRWTKPGQRSPHQVVAIRDSCVVAPHYLGDLALSHSEAEVSQVLDLFPGKEVKPVTFDVLNSALAAESPTLLHFVCHGADAVLQSIFLEGDEQLSWIQVLGMAGAVHACRSGRPLVFLNACEVARPAPTLIGSGGFAKVFIDLGARCVIAPLWSVRDDFASSVASMFYERIAADETLPFAEALRDIRKLAYPATGGEDTYAAYCLYGDPFASRSSVVDG